MVEDSQGRLPKRGDILVEKLSRNWLDKGREKVISCKWDSTVREAKPGGEMQCGGWAYGLGFVEKTIFHRRGGYHPLAPLRASDHRTEQCELIMKRKQGQDT